MPTEQAATPPTVPEPRQVDRPAPHEPVSAPPIEEELVVAPASVVPEPAPAPPDPAAIETALGLEREERVLIQQGLAAAGQEPGPTDGLFGGEQTRTRQAIRVWQAAKGLEASGYLTQEQAETLMALGQAAEEARRMAEAQEEDDRAYTEAQQADTAATYEAYLAAYPQGRHVDEARRAAQAAAERAAQEEAARQAQAADDAAYAQAQRLDTAAAYTDYLRAYPQGRHVDEAQARQSAAEAREQEAQADDVAYARAASQNTLEGYEEYLRLYPAGRHADKARAGQRRLREEAARQSILAQVNAQMVRVPGGTFTMGCQEGFFSSDKDCQYDEKPAHQVEVRSFEMSQYEVTQEVWAAVMGENPSNFPNCPQCPVESVSWDEVRAFLRKLNAEGGRYRLPSEAEWEYAARGGSQSRGYEYAGSDTPDAVAWYRGNSGGKTHSVGQKQANELGLYDLSGNVLEWVQDCWNESYAGAPSDGRAWESGDCSQRVLRGGSWDGGPRYLRSALCYRYTADNRSDNLGFRIARSLD